MGDGKVGRNERCPCGSGLKFKRCCLPSDQGPHGRTSREGTTDPGRPPHSESTFLVETPTGFLIQRLGSAAELDPGLSQGKAAEEASQRAAALWGLPDFTFRAGRKHLGSGTRELGDGVIIAGRLGLILQVKSRVETPRDDASECAWLEKVIAKAQRQAAGTVRNLGSGPTPLENLRGRTLTIDGPRSWAAVVIVDHPRCPSGFTSSPLPRADLPTLVLLRRDWEFLFDHLKSTHAVAAYIHRVASEQVELGQEAARYSDLASADAAAPATPLNPQLLTLGGRSVAGPLLPLLPTGVDDEAGHAFIRAILEDIALSPLQGADETQRLLVLGELDRLPVADRAGLGRILLDALDME